MKNKGYFKVNKHNLTCHEIKYNSDQPTALEKL